MDYTIDFVHNLISGDFIIGSYLKQISDHIIINHCDLNILNNIHKFLNVETNVFVNQNEQQMLTLTFGDLLLEMCNEHYHSKNGCTCKYHEESLIEHSIYAMLKCIEIMPLSLNLIERTRIAIVALFHDIGKINAYNTIKKKDINIISFPFHGEYGCGIMMKMWTDINPFFNKTQWSTLCRSISVHMCGYHSIEYNDDNTQYKMKLLQFENDNVKETLHWLYYGDKTGKISPYMDKNIISNLKQFKLNVTNEFKFDTFCRNMGYTGFLIKLCGKSGVGKSTFASTLINIFLSNGVDRKQIVYIERDLVMCNSVIMHQNNLLSKHEKKDLLQVKPDSALYNECYKYYKEHELQETVNNTIRNTIFLNKNKIVIVDTLMNLFASANQIYSSCCKTMFRVNINIIRNTIVDEKTCARMNMNLDEQLLLMGKVTSTQWLPKDINLHNLTAITTNKIIGTHIVQPHMCFQYAWNNNTNIGMNEIQKIAKEISKIINTNQNIIEFLSTFDNHTEIKNFMNNNAILMNYPSISSNTSMEQKCFLLKYLNHNKNFHKTWMRQVRGTVFILVDGKYICIKNLLQKGMEYLTMMHYKNDIISNETSSGTFDDVQQNIMDRFKNNESLQSTLSFKSDGSLFGVILIPKSNIKLVNIMCEMLVNCPMAKMIMEKACKYEFIPILSSSGTLSIDKTKIGYFVTSILCGMMEYDIDELCNIALTKTPLQVLEEYAIDDFLQRMNTFWTLTEKFQQNIMCLSFEAVCKQRKCAWNNLHTELAVSYDHSVLKFLGCTFNVGETMGSYRAHFQLGDIPYKCGFIEPLFWHCNHTSDVGTIIKDISNVLQTRMTIKDFYTIHPYQNKYNNIKMELDYEGFVIYVKINDNAIGTQMYDYDIDYGKAKTIEYYECHKMSYKDASKMDKYDDNVSIHMPIINNIKRFHEYSRLYVIEIVDKVHALLIECCEKTHELYNHQLLLSSKHKMITSFNKMDIENGKNTMCKMIIKTFENFNDYYLAIIKEHFSICIEDIKIWSMLLNKINWSNINMEVIFTDEDMMTNLFNLMNK